MLYVISEYKIIKEKTMGIFSRKYHNPVDGTIPFPDPRRPKNRTFHDGDGTSVRFGSSRKKQRSRDR